VIGKQRELEKEKGPKELEKERDLEKKKGKEKQSISCK
jgi:hypothetical protein